MSESKPSCSGTQEQCKFLKRRRGDSADRSEDSFEIIGGEGDRDTNYGRRSRYSSSTIGTSEYEAEIENYRRIPQSEFVSGLPGLSLRYNDGEESECNATSIEEDSDRDLDNIINDLLSQSGDGDGIVTITPGEVQPLGSPWNALKRNIISGNSKYFLIYILVINFFYFYRI